MGFQDDIAGILAGLTRLRIVKLHLDFPSMPPALRNSFERFRCHNPTRDAKFKALSLGNIRQNIPPDVDLARPWYDAEARAETVQPALAPDLRAIAAHVNRVYEEQTHVDTDRRIEERQDQLRAMSKDFASGPSLQRMKVIFDEAQIRR